MVFNYQMASLLRLVANPPYIFPRAIFPQAPFAAPSDSNPWYYYTQRWICSYLSTPSQGVTTHSPTWILAQLPCTPVATESLHVGWVGTRIKPTVLPRPKRYWLFLPCQTVDSSRQRPPGYSTILSRKILVFWWVVSHVPLIFIST